MIALADDMIEPKRGSLVSVIAAGLVATILCFMIFVSLGMATGKAVLLAWLSSAVLIPAIALFMISGPKLWRRWMASKDYRPEEQKTEHLSRNGS